MHNGKYLKKKKHILKKRTVVLALTLVLLIGTAIGGTLAWLTDKTTPVTNTFTTAGIEVTLTETFNTDTDGDNKNDKWQAQMIPGYSYTKDPTVTVKANSVDCYLFVKFEVTGTATALEYISNLNGNGWTQGEGDGEGKNGVPTNVWYRKVSSSTSDQSWELLKDNQVKISESLTKNDMPSAENAPKLVYTAYASQLYKSAGVEFSAKEAWDNITPSSGT